MSVPAVIPGTFRRRDEVLAPAGYVVVDCETTGTDSCSDEIVSLAVILLDAEGRELASFSSLVRPSGPIPAEATVVHGIRDVDVAAAPVFNHIADEVYGLVQGAVFAAHNARFDLSMVKAAFARVGISYEPVAVACTLDAFRLLEPLAPEHCLDSVCQRHGIALEDAHDARNDAVATASLLRLLLDECIAPETIRLDLNAFTRLRARGDTRPASSAQIRRVFALGYAAALSRDGIIELVGRVIGTPDVDELTRESVQDVYDARDLQSAQAA